MSGRNPCIDEANGPHALRKAYQQKPTEGGVPDDDLALLVWRMIKVLCNSRERISEHSLCLLKGNSVFREIRSSFRCIPFKAKIHVDDPLSFDLPSYLRRSGRIFDHWIAMGAMTVTAAPTGELLVLVFLPLLLQDGEIVLDGAFDFQLPDQPMTASSFLMWSVRAFVRMTF